MSVQFKSFSDRQSMVEQLTAAITVQMQKAISERNRASLVVSGGETPKSLFTQLSRQRLEWDKVTITLADERWTDTSSVQSNEYLVRSTLLVNEAAEACFIGLKSDHDSATTAEKDCENALRAIESPFDVVLLGMGDDGHTASLFPGANRLSEALDMRSDLRVLAITPEPLPKQAPFERMSMTLPCLLNSRWMVLLIAGNDKLSVYNSALAGNDILKMPVRAVLQQSVTPVSSYWAP
ncbi:MAG: 6-phosphogluconolactonase [Gammaproteobacteria bacterium]|nr:6-phosphogluconolactonase [Gammaproteobacteria bacterium]